MVAENKLVLVMPNLQKTWSAGLTLVSWVAVHPKSGRHVWYLIFLVYITCSLYWSDTLWFCDQKCLNRPRFLEQRTWRYGSGSIPTTTIFAGKNIHTQVLFSYEMQGPPRVFAHLPTDPPRWRAKSRPLRRSNTLPWDAQHRFRTGTRRLRLDASVAATGAVTNNNPQEENMALVYSLECWYYSYEVKSSLHMIGIPSKRTLATSHISGHTGHVWFTQGQVFLWQFGSTVSMTYQNLHHCCIVYIVVSGIARNLSFFFFRFVWK